MEEPGGAHAAPPGLGGIARAGCCYKHVAPLGLAADWCSHLAWLINFLIIRASYYPNATQRGEKC